MLSRRTVDLEQPCPVSATTLAHPHAASARGVSMTAKYRSVSSTTRVLFAAGVVAFFVVVGFFRAHSSAADHFVEDTQQGVGAVGTVVSADHHSVVEVDMRRSLGESICRLVSTQRTVRVLCVGDSITYGNGSHAKRKERDHEGNYPLALQQRLLTACAADVRAITVANLGHSGRTLLDGYKMSYKNSTLFKQLLQMGPQADVAIVMLGTNDAKARHWKGRAAYETALVDFIRLLSKLNPSVKILLMTPPPSFPNSRLLKRGLRNEQAVLGGIRPVIIRHEIRVSVLSAAARTGADVLDLFGEFELLGLEDTDDGVESTSSSSERHAELSGNAVELYFHDGVHPTVLGHEYMADLVSDMLVFPPQPAVSRPSPST